MRDRTREEQLDAHKHVTSMLEQAKAALNAGLLAETGRKDRANEIISIERGAIVIAAFAILMHDVEEEFKACEYDFNKLTKKMLAIIASETEFFHRVLRIPYKKWWRRS